MSDRYGNNIGLLLVDEESPSMLGDQRRYYHLRAKFCTDEDRQGNRVPDWPAYGPLYCWRDFEIACQSDNDRLGQSQPSLSYAWEYGFEHPYHVSLGRALEMVKLMRPIERKMQKMREIEGDPKTFGQFVLRVARAMGAKWMCRKREHLDGTYSFLTLVSGCNLIDAKIQSWAEKAREQGAVSQAS